MPCSSPLRQEAQATGVMLAETMLGIVLPRPPPPPGLFWVAVAHLAATAATPRRVDAAFNWLCLGALILFLIGICFPALKPAQHNINSRWAEPECFGTLLDWNRPLFCLDQNTSVFHWWLGQLSLISSAVLAIAFDVLQTMLPLFLAILKIIIYLCNMFSEHDHRSKIE